jgi:hypothetical protein
MSDGGAVIVVSEVSEKFQTYPKDFQNGLEENCHEFRAGIVTAHDKITTREERTKQK